VKPINLIPILGSSRSAGCERRSRCCGVKGQRSHFFWANKFMWIFSWTCVTVVWLY